MSASDTWLKGRFPDPPSENDIHRARWKYSLLNETFCASPVKIIYYTLM